MLESSLWLIGVLQSARSVRFSSSHRHFSFSWFSLTIYKADPSREGLLFQGVQESGDLVLPDSYNIAMVNEKSYNVNIRNKTKDNRDGEGEIMVPYSRVSMIVWDKSAGTALRRIRDSTKLSRRQLAELTNGAVSEPTIIKLELGEVEAVSREKLDALLWSLGSDVSSVFPSVVVRNF